MMSASSHNPAVVCVHGAGVNGLGIVRSLGRRGVPVTVLGIRGHENLAARSRYCSARVDVEEFSAQAMKDALLRLAGSGGVKPVLFLDNDKMMSALSPCAEELGRCFHLTSPLGETRLTDKLFQMEVAQASGVPVPKTWFPKTWDELAQLDVAPGGRLLAKPSPAFHPPDRLPFKTIVAGDTAQLASLLRAKVDSPASTIIQEYIEGGDSEIYVGLCYRSANGDFSDVWSGKKLRQFPAGAGVMAVGQAVDCEPVRTLSQKLLSTLNYHGIISTEFKYSPHNGEYYFIEFNPRTAQFHTIGWKSGFDQVYLAYLDHVQHSALSDMRSEYKNGHCWVYVYADVRARLEAERRWGALEFWRPYLKHAEWAVFTADDPRPWLRSTTKFVVWLLKRLLRRWRKHGTLGGA